MESKIAWDWWLTDREDTHLAARKVNRSGTTLQLVGLRCCRKLFPEESFGTKDLEKTTLRILKRNGEDKNANQLVQHLVEVSTAAMVRVVRIRNTDANLDSLHPQTLFRNRAFEQARQRNV